MCLSLRYFAADRRLGILDPGPDLESMSDDELHDEWLRLNAAKPTPDPVCRDCNMPYDERDGHPLLKQMCQTCGGQIFEDLTMQFIFAHGRKAKRRAASRLRRLAR